MLGVDPGIIRIIERERLGERVKQARVYAPMKADEVIWRLSGGQRLGEYLLQRMSDPRFFMTFWWSNVERPTTAEEALAMMAHKIAQDVGYQPGAVCDVPALRRYQAHFDDELEHLVWEALHSDPNEGAARKMRDHLCRFDDFRKMKFANQAKLSPAASAPAEFRTKDVVEARAAAPAFLTPKSASVAELRAAQAHIPNAALFDALSYDATALRPLVRALVERHREPWRLSRERIELTPDEQRDDDMATLCLLLRDFYRGDKIDLAAFAHCYDREGEKIAALLHARSAEPPPAIPSYDAMAGIVRMICRRVPGSEKKAIVDALVRNDRLIPKRVACLDRVAVEVERDRLRGERMIAVQHLFPTYVPLVEALADKGMRFEDMHILGTPYASNPLVVTYLRDVLGAHCEPGVDRGGNTRDFEESRVEHVQRFVSGVCERVADRPGQRWVVVDDGGMLTQCINGYREMTPEAQAAIQRTFDPKRLRGVEQTTRGMTEMAKMTLPYSVVAVATAWAKKDLGEGQVIGWALTEAFLRELKQTNAAECKRVAIVSAGSVGLAFAEHMREAGYEVTLVDRDPDKLAAARARGFAVADEVEKIVGDVDAVLGATGKTSLSGETLKNFRGVIGQGSSAAIEFDEQQLRAYNPSLQVLNRGRPMNFHGDGHENLSAAQIGLTRALMFAAIVQPKGAAGVQDLGDGLQRIAYDHWKANKGDAVTKISARPAPPRPDLYGRATHKEWMTYLRNLPAGVVPRVNDALARPGLYCFEEPKGRFRLVDTRVGDAVSIDAPFTRLPDQLIDAGTRSQPRAFMALSRTKEGTSVRAMIMRGDAIEYLPVAETKGLATSLRLDFGEEGDPTERSLVGYAFDMGEVLRVYPPGQWSNPVTVKKASLADSVFLWPKEGVFMQIERASGKTHVLLAQEEDPEPIARFASLVSVDGVTVAIGTLPELRFVVGKDASGAVVLVPAAKVRGTYYREPKPIVLPKGAVFRDVKKLSWCDVQIAYAMPGKGQELEALETITVSMTGEIG
ncbi:MAG: hypothetical protein IT381_05155 [Deltaproteobacteria bacterium]|nr:hypothetical protein [Deltaproteobacteria bacterium]